MKDPQYDRKYLATEIIKTFGPAANHTNIAEILDIGRSTIYKWVDRQIRFNVYEADRYAIKLGLHPCEIWDDWFTMELEETA